ncbi:MAG: enoyl-CoA hydratase/isomerase family protein [Euryarchaeota archaeon]|nr:enoyl-CoA hydratase/isomerase family protein [Euryarchaeota archaeon]MDE1837561.1 enoyl-CoA hydratase/isomerase family protein [Euryarchaeota archaeon]MDE1880042.1 enoyl-CoA hydratase/isomerase family protein [Euryarchaeota archaeon]MDE2046129.1 enoyl-CoA hydratase/isomerase family protein [Thermoplasmata archaeon]
MAAARRSTPKSVATEKNAAPAAQAGPLVLVERRGPVAVLTLNNPPVNILTTPLLEELAGQVLELSDDPTVRALVLTGGGDKAFSGGADIKEMVKMDREEASRHSAKGQAVANLLERSPLPVIAAVKGYCLGGGCEISQACDFIIASDDAVFGQPEINIGVIPGWGGSRRLTRAVGAARARDWIMTGEKVGAERALKDGLLHAVVPRAKLLDEAVALGQKLATKPAVALAACKYAVNQASDASRLMGLEYERELWGLLFETEDQKEGMQAFLEKRPAQFPDQRDWTRRKPEFPWESPGNPLESAKVLAYQRATGPSVGPVPPRFPSLLAIKGPYDVMAMAEAYREAGQRAFETFFALMRSASDNYQSWTRAAMRENPVLRYARPPSSGKREEER